MGSLPSQEDSLEFAPPPLMAPCLLSRHINGNAIDEFSQAGSAKTYYARAGRGVLIHRALPVQWE